MCREVTARLSCGAFETYAPRRCFAELQSPAPIHSPNCEPQPFDCLQRQALRINRSKIGLGSRAASGSPAGGRSQPSLGLTYVKRAAPTGPALSKLLLTKTQFLDQRVVALHIFLLEVCKKIAALVHHHKEATT